VLPLTTLRSRLRHVRWIGGGSGAGKSTIARRLAAEHGLEVCSTDDAMLDHARRCSPEDAPQLTRFLDMDDDERWVHRSPETMLETFHWFRGEAFGLVVEDLLRSSPERGVIVEGFRLLPHLVAPLLTSPPRAVWLLPTSEFRRDAFESRGTAWDIPRRTSDPERALRNLLERDALFTDRLSEETKRLGLPAVRVDTGLSEDGLARRAEEILGL
jgi:2-phosphoglycerate kinase